MITVHVDIVEKDGKVFFHPYVSGVPTKLEELVANQLQALIVRAMNAPESPQEKPKPRRKRK